jgi:excisionase family DNA binding protein
MAARVEVVIEPLAVGYADAAKMIGVGRTKVWQLAKEGKLKTIKIGADSKITVESIRKYVADLAAASG